MKLFLKDLGAFVESVIIAVVVSVGLYYLLVWVLPQKSDFTVAQSKAFAFWGMLIYGTVMVIYGMLDHFKKDSKKNSNPREKQDQSKV